VKTPRLPMAVPPSAFRGLAGESFRLPGLAQAAHSIEEAKTGLSDFLWPAMDRFLVASGVEMLAAPGRRTP
jgi:hypothetical protein